jgi:AcrR family transcriptional regulator
MTTTISTTTTPAIPNIFTQRGVFSSMGTILRYKVYRVNAHRLGYADGVPKLWNSTIEEHRRSVHAAIIGATVELVDRHGLAGVTMSQIAQATGIGRATLYKYFPDVASIMVAWHERQIADHLEHLAAVRDHGGSPIHRLEAVLRAFALITHERHGGELATLLHQGDHVRRAQQHLRDFVTELVAEAVAAGEVRTDVAPAELAAFCLHALTAAGALPSKAAVGRLVSVTMAGLGPSGE